MATLKPVDYDPFAPASGPKLTPVDNDPFATEQSASPSLKLTPVEHDPFAESGGFVDNAKTLAATGITALRRGVLSTGQMVNASRAGSLMDAAELARQQQADEANPTLRDVPVQQNLPATLDTGSYAEADRRRLAEAKPYDTVVKNKTTPEEYVARARANLIDLAKKEAEIKKLPAPKVVQDALQSKTFGEFWTNFKKAPATIITSIGFESAPLSLGIAGATAVGGATAGVPGAMALTGAVSSAVEYTSSITDALREEGVDFADPASVEKALADDKLMARVEKRASARALPVGALDAVTAGIASKVLIPARMAERLAAAPVRRELTNLVPQMGAQAVGGAAGEAGAQLASGQDWQPGAIAAEAAGELVTTPADVVAASLARGERPVGEFERVLREIDGKPAPAAAGGLPTPEGIVPAQDIPPPPPAPPVAQSGYEAMYGEAQAPAAAAEAPAPPSAVSTVLQELGQREGGKKSPLGKGLSEITAGQKGGQAAVDRVAGSETVTFKTAKGSTYAVQADGTTIRNKALRNDPGHEGDQGVKPRTEKTFYIPSKEAQRLAAPDSATWRVIDHGDGTLSLATRNPDGRWGVSPDAKNVPVTTEPAVGLTPIELWGKEKVYRYDAYKTVHFGNDIVEVNKPQRRSIPVGEPVKITTPDDSAEIEARPVLVELDTLKPASGKLQPRDRARVEMVQEAKERAVRLDPARLMPDRVSDAGAPIVTADGTVISGNGRMLSIAEVYSNPALRAQANAYKAALPAEAQGMSKPVLVMQSQLSGLDAERFAQQSNRPRIATLSATEQANTDAAVMGDILDLYQGGDFEASANAPFLKAFATNVVASSERNSFSKDGQLSAEGMRRMQGAILARAYGETGLLSRMLESTDDNVRAIVGALQDAAPQMAALRKAVQAGQVMEGLDPLPDISAAVSLISDMRKKRLSPAKFFRQMDAFTEVNPDVAGWVLSLYNPADPKTGAEAGEHALSRPQMAAVFRAFANEAMQHKTGGFFDDETTRAGILSAVGRNAAQGATLAEAPGAGSSDGSGGTAGGQAPTGGRGPQAALGDAQTATSPGAQQGEVDQRQRAEAKKRLRLGLTYEVPLDTVYAVHDAIRQDIGMIPSDIRVAVVERIEPIPGGKVGEEKVKVHLRLTTGEPGNLIYPREFILKSGAVFDPDFDLIFFIRYGDVSEGGAVRTAFDKRIRGELRHELLHALRIARVITEREWRALVSHARYKLQVLTFTVASFAQLTGKPVTATTSQKRLDRAYEELYQANGISDAEMQERLDQEAVTHALELAYHGKLNAKELAPLQGLIDKMELRLYGRGAQPAGADVMASLSPTSAPSLDPDDAGRLRKARDSALEFLQDAQLRVRRLVERANEPLPDDADPYMAATLYHGRLGGRAEAANQQAKVILQGANAIAKATNSPLENVKRLIDLYLVAKHAPERNAVHGDGSAGITNAEATAALARISALPQSAEIIRVAGLVQDMNRQTLKTLLDGRVISQETFDLLSTTYANHVPLNRILPEGDEEIAAVLAGGGFDVRGTGLQRARGSKLPIAPILENVLLNHEQAIVRAEKNTVDLATLAFVRRFEDDLKGQITILGGPKPARTIDAAERGIRDQIAALKKMLPKDDRPHHMDRMPTKSINDPRVLELREDGERVLIRFRDPKLAAAFKATNSEKMPKVLYPAMLYTRVMSQLATRFNPEFAPPNKIRDIQETAVYIAAQKELGFKGAAKFALRELRGENYKAIVDWMMGRDTPGARLYQEMIDEGGTTGGLALSSRDRVQESIAEIEKLVTASPANIRKVLKATAGAFDNLNKVFEDSTRLSAYRSAKARGLTKKRAAVHAKEASINFNRMGTAGHVINGLWMFSNASIQGTTKMIRAMKNPKVAGVVVLGMAAAVTAVGEWNDQWDEKWREKVTKWDRLNSLVVVLPSSTPDQFNYFVIPISWGLKPILNLTNYAYDAEQGIDWEWGDFLNDMTVATLEAANPLGGTSLTQALVPTALDLPVDLRSNVSWSGSKIKPDPQRGVPEDVRYFNSLQDKASGRASIAATEALVDSTGIAVSPADVNYVFEQLVGGVGRTAGRFWTAGSAVVNGEVPDKDQFPFLARFYRRREGEEIGAGGQGLGAETRAVRELVEGQGRERIRRKYRLEDVVEELKTLPKDQVKKRIAEEVKKDPAAFDVIKGLIEAEAKGLTGLDKQINLLGVENGERARYYFDRLREASPEDRRSIVEDGVKKGLISRGVIEQIGMLNQLERLSPEQRKKARSLASENGLQLPPE